MRAPCPPSNTRSPGLPAAGSGVCWDDHPGDRRGPHPAWLRPGFPHRTLAGLLEAIVPPPSPPGRPDPAFQHFLGLAGPELRRMSGGPASGLCRRPGGGLGDLGTDPGTAVHSPVPPALDPGRPSVPVPDPTGYKNFQNFPGFFKKTICICEKMGYNRMEYPSPSGGGNRRQVL